MINLKIIDFGKKASKHGYLLLNFKIYREELLIKRIKMQVNIELKII